MIYIIDGHNLIPKIPGLNLKQMNDEDMLISNLQEFSRIKQRKIEVFFDKAAPGFSGIKSAGCISVHYVPERMKADEAIINRVRRAKGHGNEINEIVVVSSDQHVQFLSKKEGAKYITSEQFEKEMERTFNESDGSSPSYKDRKMSEAEVNEWLELFNKKRGKD